MLSSARNMSVFTRATATQARVVPAALQAVRGFAEPRSVSQKDNYWSVPASEFTLYRNEFDHGKLEDFVREWEEGVKHPIVHDTEDLVQSTGDPHTRFGFSILMFSHYDFCREFVLPRVPDVSKGELVSGANLTRTSVWHNPNEPAIVSVAKFEPDNFRAVGWAQNDQVMETACPEELYDYRQNRLKPGHADRRPFYYFVGACVWFFNATMIRGCVCKVAHYLWPARDVFALGTVEVDMRQIAVGQNFVVKFRGKPVFLRHRTAAMIAAAKADDAILATLRDPELDSKRCPIPQWLIVLGVCTHLGCVPYPDQGNWGGYFCPCHGSHYDHSGRIRQGPAPTNLEIPVYEWVNADTIRLG